MITGIDLTQTVDFTLKEDKENPTIWKIGCLRSSEMAKIASDAQGGDFMKQMFHLVKRGVKGWENFNIPFKTQAGTQDQEMDQEVLDKIPLSAIVELGTRILEANNLSAKESKN